MRVSDKKPWQLEMTFWQHCSMLCYRSRFCATHCTCTYFSNWGMKRDWGGQSNICVEIRHNIKCIVLDLVILLCLSVYFFPVLLLRNLLQSLLLILYFYVVCSMQYFCVMLKNFQFPLTISCAVFSCHICFVGHTWAEIIKLYQ